MNLNDVPYTEINTLEALDRVQERFQLVPTGEDNIFFGFATGAELFFSESFLPESRKTQVRIEMYVENRVPGNRKAGIGGAQITFSDGNPLPTQYLRGETHSVELPPHLVIMQRFKLAGGLEDDVN